MGEQLKAIMYLMKGKQVELKQRQEMKDEMKQGQEVTNATIAERREKTNSAIAATNSAIAEVKASQAAINAAIITVKEEITAEVHEKITVVKDHMDGEFNFVNDQFAIIYSKKLMPSLLKWNAN